MFTTDRDSNKTYRVTLVNKQQGLNKTIFVQGDEYILDAADEQGIPLPYSCRTGNCINCTAKILSGALDQYDHNFLRQKELDAGFALLCASYAISDCVLETDQEDALLDL